MIGIAEMFAELDGYQRYEDEFGIWSHYRRATEQRQANRYKTPTGRLYRRQYMRAWYETNREQWNAYQRAYRKRPPRVVASHGTRAKYVGGCRCGSCRNAETTYRRERRRQIKETA